MGRNPRIGTASDWVWFNVPHGPQKQVACFLRAYECCKAGKEEVHILRPHTTGLSTSCHRLELGAYEGWTGLSRPIHIHHG